MIETLAIAAVAAFFVGVAVAVLTSTALRRSTRREVQAPRPNQPRKAADGDRNAPSLDPSAHAALALASVRTTATQKRKR
jgi:hypothetical protein